MKFVVTNRGTAESLNPKEKHVIISVSGVGNRANIKGNDNTLDVLYLEFDDIDMVRDGFKAFCRDDAKKILLFVTRYELEARTVYIHCDAGQSRSPAIAAALCKIYDMDDSDWFKTKTPNRRVYRGILQEYGFY